MSGANTGERGTLVFQNLCSVGLELNEASIHHQRVQKLQLKYWCRSVYFSQPGLFFLSFSLYMNVRCQHWRKGYASFPELVFRGTGTE